MEMKLEDLKLKSPTELLSFAEENGVENAPKAFLNLFSGANTGKMLVKLG